MQKQTIFLRQRESSMRSSRRTKGLTLVELMVGILVGMILMAAVISVYVASIRSNGAVLTMAQLNHEVRSVAELVANDIRRAGFDNITNSRTLANLQNDYDRIEISDSGDCVRFGYDRSVDALESFGFRRVEGADGIGVIEMKFTADDTTCANWGSSNSAALTDERRVDITEFQLRTADEDAAPEEGSRCFNLALRGPSEPPPALELWSWLALDGAAFPCSRSDLGVEGASPEAIANTQDGDLLVEHRQLFLTVTGRATSPAGRAGTGQPLEATFTTEVRVPNNRRLLATVSP
jgi:Tfp pilus assembly protein PilE